tara:strand:+ start:334 stop:975 length:642 start_codon:yes stop_codon:yes gene_type:complete
LNFSIHTLERLKIVEPLRQTFFNVGKIRNTVIGHNAPQKVETWTTIGFLKSIKDMFSELCSFFENPLPKIKKCENEISKIIQNYFIELWKVSDDDNISTLASLSETIWWAIRRFISSKIRTDCTFDQVVNREMRNAVKINIFLFLAEKSSFKHDRIEVEQTLQNSDDICWAETCQEISQQLELRNWILRCGPISMFLRGLLLASGRWDTFSKK